MLRFCGLSVPPLVFLASLRTGLADLKDRGLVMHGTLHTVRERTRTNPVVTPLTSLLVAWSWNYFEQYFFQAART